jgi:NAD(P)-dependent dehydrogenase (short-subunit alcohol dehydrogenase family)
LPKAAPLQKAAKQAGVALHVCDTESVIRSLDRIIEADGKIDALINNAGAECIINTQNTDEKKHYQTADEVAVVVMACLKSDKLPLRMRPSPSVEAFCDLKTQADPDRRKLQAKLSTKCSATLRFSSTRVTFSRHSSAGMIAMCALQQSPVKGQPWATE